MVMYASHPECGMRLIEWPDVLDRAQTALDNTADYEKRHGRGINLTPIITDLMVEVRRLRNLT